MLAAMRQQKKDGVANYVWQLKSLPANTQWSGLAYGNGRFVAVSGDANPKLATFSTNNGASWSTPSVITPSSSAGIYRMTFGNGLFVACGFTGAGPLVPTLWTSPDGIAWTQRSSPFFARNISFANGLFFLTDANGGAVSADAINWTIFNKPGFAGGLSNVAYGNSVYVASNATNYMYSTTGSTWSAVTAWTGTPISYGLVGFGNGFFLSGATAENPSILKKSFDGFSFLNRSSGIQFGNCSSVIYTGSRFVLPSNGGAGRCLVTIDGESYVQTNTFPGSTLSSSGVFGNGVVMMLNTDPQFYGASSAVYVMEIS